MEIIKEGNINSYVNQTDSKPQLEVQKQTEFNKKQLTTLIISIVTLQRSKLNGIV